jgi:hypothetical protein
MNYVLDNVNALDLLHAALQNTWALASSDLKHANALDFWHATLQNARACTNDALVLSVFLALVLILVLALPMIIK